MRWGAETSEWKEMREGTAQGTNSAPALFDALLDDLKGVEMQYADDAVAVVQAATEEACVDEMNAKDAGAGGMGGGMAATTESEQMRIYVLREEEGGEEAEGGEGMDPGGGR